MAGMFVLSLQSGSNGNCIYVETRGIRLLFDAGISGKQAETRLAQYDRDIRQVDALVVSHDHSDHTRSIGIFQRKFDLPVYLTPDTLDAVQANRAQVTGQTHLFDAGSPLVFGNVTVETIPTPHDGVDGVAFVVDDGRSRLGILTDLGHPFPELDAVVASLDAILIESNYDPDMLDHGPYPPFLKRRIRGPGGHLSNNEAAELLHRSGSRLHWACLGHLSEHNNRPELALCTHRHLLGSSFPLHVASRYEATVLHELG
jgi:phosphoribosyl 1,2-cyclic phosphodiesterase